MIHVRLPDGATRALDPASTAADLAASISPSLAKRTVAAVVDGQLADLTAPLPDGAAVELLPRDDPRALELIRHDLAHVLAEAVQSPLARHEAPPSARPSSMGSTTISSVTRRSPPKTCR